MRITLATLPYGSVDASILYLGHRPLPAALYNIQLHDAAAVVSITAVFATNTLLPDHRHDHHQHLRKRMEKLMSGAGVV